MTLFSSAVAAVVAAAAAAAVISAVIRVLLWCAEHCGKERCCWEEWLPVLPIFLYIHHLHAPWPLMKPKLRLCLERSHICHFAFWNTSSHVHSLSPAGTWAGLWTGIVVVVFDFVDVDVDCYACKHCWFSSPFAASLRPLYVLLVCVLLIHSMPYWFC